MHNLRDMMHQDVISVTLDQSVQEAAELMLQNDLSDLPVVDTDSGELLGSIGELDCLKALAEGQLMEHPHTPLAVYMNARAESIPAGATLFDCASWFMKHPVRHLPVVQDGHLIGIISRHDVLEYAMSRIRQKPDQD